MHGRLHLHPKMVPDVLGLKREVRCNSGAIPVAVKLFGLLFIVLCFWLSNHKL